MDKVPGHEATWNCSGDTWLYPGGDALDDDLKFVRRFRIGPIPNQAFLKGTCRAGELLNEGHHQIRLLGDFLLSTYGSIVGKSKRHFRFRSTYANRCLACLQVLAHKMMSGSDPIDVFVANEELEALVPNPHLCPAFEGVMDEVLNDSSPFGSELAAYNSRMKQIKKSRNLSATPHWMRMGELLVTQHCAGVGFPPGMDTALMVDSQQLLLHFYRQAFATEKTTKMGAGLLLSEIYFGLRDYLVGGSDAHITLICGHTLSIVSLFAALNMTIRWPEYGTMVGFDLLQTQDQYAVRVTVNGESHATYSWREFENLAVLMRPSEEECKVKYPFPERDKKNTGSKMLAMSFS
jgi:hypothetical protein